MDMLPTSVKLVIGDVGDPAALRSVVEGCNKIIYCATARSSITFDLNRVDHQGVYNLSKGFQDYNNKLAQLRAGKSSKSKLLLAKFKSAKSLNGKSGDAGYVYTRGYVDLSTKLSLPLSSTLDRYEGLILLIGGNRRSYVLILESGPTTDASHNIQYISKISTKVGFCRVSSLIILRQSSSILAFNLDDDNFKPLWASASQPFQPYSEVPSQPVADDSLVEEVKPVQPKRKYTRRSKPTKKNDKEFVEPWTIEEEIALCKAYVAKSEDSVEGNGKKAAGFWREVAEHFHEEMGEDKRSYDSVNCKWKK
uniref:Myb-like domain-containing protein n=1 Tax=Tanacetum cinerariifolium TaxID=118510 RepID=A0A6L2LUU5_TANCI|nr:hypothetical protein [Tanacetum cinerariifolium]